MLYKYIENIYKAEHLYNAWNKIPQAHRDKLDMELEGGSKLSGWDQFTALYDEEILCYENLTKAENAFIYIFMSNLFILEQIGKHKEQIQALANMDNWKDVVINYTVGAIEGNIKNSSANTTKTTSSTDNTNKLDIKRTDSNSYTGPEGEPVPFNQLEAQANLTNNKMQDSTETMDYSINDSNTLSKTGSKTESSNNAKDALDFLRMEVKNLYNSFWAKFRPLFFANI